MFRRGLPLSIEEEESNEEYRYLLLRVCIADNYYTLPNIYAPNQPNLDFFSKLNSFSLTWGDSKLIMGGEFNTTQCPWLNNSHTSTPATLISKDLLHFKEALSLYDLWLIMNSEAKEYSH